MQIDMRMKRIHICFYLENEYINMVHRQMSEMFSFIHWIEITQVHSITRNCYFPSIFVFTPLIIQFLKAALVAVAVYFASLISCQWNLKILFYFCWKFHMKKIKLITLNNAMSLRNLIHNNITHALGLTLLSLIHLIAFHFSLISFRLIYLR